MKKIIYFLAGAITCFSLTAFASSGFTDEADFADWFSDSVAKMQFNGIMTGYPDGSFMPEDNVNRAQLAVILDRYSTTIVGEELLMETPICTMEVVKGIEITVMDQEGNRVSNATVQTEDELVLTEESDGNYVMYEGEEGYYDITIEKFGYRTYTETIKLERETCHAITQHRTITLIETLPIL
ncbi:MAG: S-layer homology domain-containing protein [Candidatus Gracilibacteria bacterium]|jgi:hypothetical protein